MAFSVLIVVSPFTLVISLIALWFFTKKKPNEKFRKFAKNSVIASIVGLVFFTLMGNSESEEINVASDQATEQVVVAEEDNEENTEEVDSQEIDFEEEEDDEDDEEKRLAEEQKQREQYQKLQEQKQAEQKEQELKKEQQKKEQEELKKQEELERKEQEEREKEIAEANPNKSSDTKAPNKPVEVPQGKEDVKVNNNIPFFSNEDISSTEVYHRNGSLDSLGRETAANAVVGVDIMPAEERGSIGHIEPSGWNQARYANIGSGGWLYNRSHLIGHQMTGNDDRENLMTGTRWFNMRMLEYENWVANYVESTENLVRYRVTPVFEGNNLVASGAYMEAFSIEDNGEGVMFNIYVPNIQPGVEINYANGSSVGPAGPAEEGEITNYNGNKSNSSSSSSKKPATPTPAPKTEKKPAPAPAPKPEEKPAGGDLSSVDANGNGKVTIQEAKDAGYSMPIYSDHWLYQYMDDRNNNGMVGE
ncbi:DNA/RNA non-specific endonuclease [Alkalibacterium sp. MB6]|uniref:DNA/RNA non-specific endonuclease n=1 Tax=Alkalibacterium sp. MB6 TaxID=2081965 RepID=UPI00137B931E|nr:DNA/RNA non-specific endonuclease [Alkalibacterium sp. MB6]